jgi:hypothetical protein
MVEQARGSSYTQILYGPGGGKLALMNGLTTLVKAFVPLPGGATAVYGSGGTLAYYRHPDWLGSARLASSPSRTVVFHYRLRTVRRILCHQRYNRLQLHRPESGYGWRLGRIDAASIFVPKMYPRFAFAAILAFLATCEINNLRIINTVQ